MASCRRRPVTKFLFVVWLFLAFIFILVNSSHCSRLSTQKKQQQEQQELDVFKLKPKNHKYSGHFLGFLPRRIPIPASGPSRKHNDIGLKAWRSP
ncbi:hypothetical protein M0R45_005539 [Rubus argutus]|uniref:Uncharacterized protein n=1 Tax=Rubus argutus TaxID=59490 RepID=A0AAW1YN34_RUBAR